MANLSLTDYVYDNIERIDKQKRRMKIMVMEFFFPALLCSVMSGYFYLVYSHQKGGLSDIKTAIVALLALACIILLGIAAIKLINYVKLNNKLKSIEALEDTIYKEVLEYHADSLQ
jgi:hypothetical protein